MFAVKSNRKSPYDPLMDQPTAPDDSSTGQESDGPKPATTPWIETPKGRATASVVSVAFLGALVAAVLVSTHYSNESQEVTEPATPTTTTPTTTPASTTTSTPPSRATTTTTTVAPTTSVAPRVPTYVPTYAPAFPPPSVTPTTSAAPPLTEKSTPSKPSLNVTRDPDVVATPQGTT